VKVREESEWVNGLWRVPVCDFQEWWAPGHHRSDGRMAIALFCIDHAL